MCTAFDFRLSVSVATLCQSLVLADNREPLMSIVNGNKALVETLQEAVRSMQANRPQQDDRLAEAYIRRADPR